MAKKERTTVHPKPLKCSCAHTYQNGKYGKGMRLHNPVTGKDGTFSAGRCTVCGAERPMVQ